MDNEIAGMTELSLGENSSHVHLSWNVKHAHYGCRDGKCIEVPRRTASVKDLRETKIIPKNRVTYAVGDEEQKITVSGTVFSRDMKIVFRGSDGIRTTIFPCMVRTVR